MLTYHPATDFYHCWMRCASIILDAGSAGIEFDRFRIVDFLLCFPQLITDCRLPAGHAVPLRKSIKLLPKTYEDLISIKQGFGQVSRIQTQVAMDMVAKGVMQRDKFREGNLIPDPKSSTSELLHAVAAQWATRDEGWYQLAVGVLQGIPLNGKDGLKDRSGLLEYRYDG